MPQIVRSEFHDPLNPMTTINTCPRIGLLFSLIRRLVMAAGSGYSVLFCLLSILASTLAQSDADLGIENGPTELKLKDRGEQFDKDFAVLNQDNSKTVGAK